MTRATTAALIASVMVLAIPDEAKAHNRSVSYATWTVLEQRATVELRLSRLDQNALEASTPAGVDLAELLQHQVALLDDRGRCRPAPESFSRLRAGTGWIRAEWQVRCATAAHLRVHSDLLFGIVPGHLHFARVAGDVTSPELLLDEAHRELAVATASDASFWRTARRYVSLGIWHLAGGWDHVAFVLVLLLAAASLRELVSAVSGFTIGHSASLALAASGAIRVDTAAVEALIGLSILLVAAESVWLAERRRAVPVAAVAGLLACAASCAVTGPVGSVAVLGIALFAGCYFALLARTERTVALRWCVAALFGVIHGFGFASVLGQLSAGGVRPLPLVSFNVGVEIGQLAIVAVAWPLLCLARRLGHQTLLLHFGGATAACLGAFWFASRAWF